MNIESSTVYQIMLEGDKCLELTHKPADSELTITLRDPQCVVLAEVIIDDPSLKVLGELEEAFNLMWSDRMEHEEREIGND